MASRTRSNRINKLAVGAETSHNPKLNTETFTSHCPTNCLWVILKAVFLTVSGQYIKASAWDFLDRPLDTTPGPENPNVDDNIRFTDTVKALRKDYLLLQI